MRRRFFIVRHGQTVFNAAARIQGETLHTPLTRAGFAQAEAIGRILRAHLGPRPDLELWSSPAGRALQTLAVAAEHLNLDWHAARVEPRLAEMAMGSWSGRSFADIVEEDGPITDEGRTRFVRQPPGGEWYDALAERLQAWLDEQAAPGDRLAVMHGISSRVLRGLMTGMPPTPECAAPLASPVPQGTVVVVEDGVERVLAAAGG